MNVFRLMLLVAVIFLASCSGDDNPPEEEKSSSQTPAPVSQQLLPNSWKPSSTFDLDHGQTVIGIQGQAALSLRQPFPVGEPTRVEWFFWGEEQELKEKTFSVIGVHENEKSVEKVLIDPENELLLWMNSEPIQVTGQAAVAKAESDLFFSKAGLWCLNVYVGNQLYGQIVIEVE
ncbi:MAG: DUF4871 domain-containing protein [Bacillaceae bacterium]|nr:DUF4871 domain-containing protein [Bacillaceae bacterium]